MINHWNILCVWLLLILSVGCNSSSSSRTGVQGKVSYQGKVVEKGQIEFYPTSGTTGPMVGSEIEQGNFHIGSEKGPFVGGTYQVRIVGFRKTGTKVASKDRPQDDPGDLYENFVPETFNSKSELKVSISGQDPNQLD